MYLLFTFVIDGCLISALGPTIQLLHFEKKSGSCGKGLFCSSQWPR